MKNVSVPTSLLLAFCISCASTPASNMDSSSATTVESDGMGSITSAPTPNVNYEANAVSSSTQMDPEGDIAPLVPCKDGEIERRQSGKIVCVSPDKDRSGSTMSGR